MSTDATPVSLLAAKCAQHSRSTPLTLAYLLRIANHQDANSTPALHSTIFGDTNPATARTIIKELEHHKEITTVSLDGETAYEVTLECPPECRNWGLNHELNPDAPGYVEAVRDCIADDERLSFKAKGIALFLLKNPELRTTGRNIAKHSPKEERGSVETGLKELARYGYLQHVSEYYAIHHVKRGEQA